MTFEEIGINEGPPTGTKVNVWSRLTGENIGQGTIEEYVMCMPWDMEKSYVISTPRILMDWVKPVYKYGFQVAWEAVEDAVDDFESSLQFADLKLKGIYNIN